MTRADIPSVCKMLMEKQHGICPICGKDLTRALKVNVVIDHDHRTGIVRAAVHRGCNRVEGSVWSTVNRWGKATGLIQVKEILRRLITFWELHSKPQTDIIYYGHKTTAEKAAAYKKKRRIKTYAEK